MKTSTLFIALCLLTGDTGAFAETAPVGTVARAARIGVYDSRAVSFAYFWSEAGAKTRNELITAARAAKAAGDSERFKRLNADLTALQKRNHLQVFSTAPADDAMNALKEKLPLLAAELGVDRFISKWDSAALHGTAEANRIDVTDQLVRALFTPTVHQEQTLEAIKRAAPIPWSSSDRG